MILSQVWIRYPVRVHSELPWLDLTLHPGLSQGLFAPGFTQSKQKRVMPLLKVIKLQLLYLDQNDPLYQYIAYLTLGYICANAN